MKKRLLSLLTAIVMITVVCISPVSMYAATTRCDVTADWEAWDLTNSLPTTAGYYYLNSDVKLNVENISISGSLYLDLNGKTVTFTNTASKQSAIVLSDSGSKVYLYDSVGGGKITKASETSYERCFYIHGGSVFMYGGTISGFNYTGTNNGGAVLAHGTDSKFEMHGGTITECAVKVSGGAVEALDGGTVSMAGGTISECSAQNGGAVSVMKGSFSMTGGIIESCRANGYGGGGVYVGTESTFTMSGNSSIENCSAVSSSGQESRYGGGVYVNGGTFTMSAGSSIKNCNAVTEYFAFGGGVSVMGTNAKFTLSGNIEGCKVDAPTRTYGGGVHIGSAGTFTMDGGSIKSCTAVLAGGAVGVENGSFTMSNSGVIDNCNALKGGGVWSNINTTVIMNNKSIVKNCKATGGNDSNGGGVKISGTFEMTGSSIENCSAVNGGGLYYDDGTVIDIKDGSSIKGCTSTGSGGGVYAGRGTTTMTDSSIEACNTTNSGGGVRVLQSNTSFDTSFTMTNSSIIGCKAANGGGVRVENSATFTINSGSIQNCIASGSAGGGGVFATTPYFSMAGGSIKNCTATANGGGVYIKTSGNRFDMTGGSITCCEATNGGGLYVYDPATFNLSNGNIQNCTVTGYGGGVYDNGIITLGSTAQITGNVKGGTITDGVLSGGSANNLYIASGKTVTIGMGENVPASGMSVGVTTATAPTASTPVALTGDNEADYSSYFSSDNSTYELKNISNVLKLMKKGVITNSTPEGNKSANGGYISIDKENAWPDEIVTITVTPNTAYTLKSLKYNDGTDHDITDAKTFTMPAADVTVTAVFEHNHSFTYSVDGTNSYILKATCIDGCPNGYYANPLTLTLTKPSNLIYDGSEKTINFADGEAAAWKNATGFDAPVITYTAKEGSALTGDKAVNVGSYTATATIDTDKTATLDFTITPVTLAMDMSGVTVTKTYDKTNDATVSKGTLVGILTADNGKVSVQDSVAATFNGANAGTGIAVTLTEDFVLSGDAAGNYALTQPAGITGSITAKDVTDTRDAESQTVIIGEGTFTAPVFHDAELDEDITGTLTYTYNSETKTKQEIEAVLATLSQSATGTISYSYVADGNYTGTITGTINYTAEGILFKVAGEAATVANAIKVKDAPTYEDTWDEIITISDDIVVSVNGKTGSGTYTLNVSGTPNAGLQGYSVIFNGTVNGKSYTDVTVLSGTVTIAKADWNVTAPIAKDSLMYTGTEQALVNAGSVEEGGKLLYSTDGSDFSETISKATDAGTYNIYYKVAGDDNHNGFSGEQPIEVTIGKADWNVTAPMANSLCYTGADQELVTAGMVRDVTGAAGEKMYYRLAGETDYSESIPTGNAVDTYNVEYKVAGSANYNEYTSTAPVTVTIGKALRTDIPKVTMDSYKYGASAIPQPFITPSRLTENPSITYYYNTAAELAGAEVWEKINSTTLNARSYYMFALIGATENYIQCYTEFAGFDIAKADPVYPQAIPVSGTEEAQGEEKTETPAEEYIAPTAEYDEQIEAGEALVPVKAEISDGIATVEEITEDELQDLVDEIVNVATKEVPSLVIDLSQATQDVTGVDLTAKTLEAIADIVNDESNPIESVKLELSEAIVELDAKTLEAVVEEAEGDIIRLVVEDTEEESLNKSQNATLMHLDVDRTFEAYFESAGRRIHDFKGGNAHVSLSFKPGKSRRVENYKVYYIDEKGAPQKMTTKYENGLITFVTTHFSDYAVVYENVQDILLAEAATTKKGYIRLSWNEIDGAVRYVVYGARCGKAYKQLAELDAVTDGCSFTVKKINGVKPVSGRIYKLYVAAYDALGNRIKSKAIHFIAGNTSGECGNVETITALQKSLTLTVGEKIAVGVEYTVFDDKKRVSEKHGAALRFTSDCPDVAKVSKDGTITARREGKAVIYIQDVSGKWCQAEVTVKEK